MDSDYKDEILALEDEINCLEKAYFEVEKERLEMKKQIAQLQAELGELLYAVEQNVPGETRHQAALRLIRNAQECSGNNEKSIEGAGNG